MFCVYWDAEFFSMRPFLKEVAEKMQSIADKKTTRLAISMPPRAGKSYIASLYSAWILGRNPQGSVMRNSCTETLANKFGRDMREIIKDVKFKVVFPEATLSKDKTSVKGWNLEQAKSVSYFGGGVGTTIAGFGATDVAILDDPIKNVEDAMSELVLEKTWDWYTGVHSARLEKGCPEIHISTRWSRRDPIGMIEEAGDFDDIIVVPALDDNDESFCDDVNTTEYYHRIRNITADFIWNAEFQQEPVEAKGLLFPKDKLNWFDIKGLKRSDENIAVVDVADKGDDYLSCVVANVVGNKAYVVDVVFTQEPIEVTEGMVAQALISNNVSLCRIESNSGGRAFSKNIEKILRDEGHRCTIDAKPTTKNKETRMNMKSGIVREFTYFRDDDNRDRGYKMFIQQLCSTFRTVKKNKHDDAADSITMLAELIGSKENHWVL